MIMITYNSAIDEEVSEILVRSGIQNYTRFNRVLGKGTTSGPHMATDVWPGENSVLFCAVETEKKEVLMKGINELRSKLGKEGVKAFAWEISDMT